MSPSLKRALVLVPLLLLLAGCTIAGVDIEQEQATGLAGELLDGRSFGQTFVPQNDGLYRIDLYTATYARENTRPVIFRIRLAPDAGQDLVYLELALAQISNSGPTLITFSPLAGTAGQTLYFSLESPGSAPGDAVTLYRHQDDVYPAGEMYVDGEPAGGDLAFIAYTRQTLTLADIWGDFYGRASQDRPFFFFYGSLLTLLLVGSVVALVWPRRRQAQDSPDASPSATDEEGT